jgi:hypothetical protein
VTVAAYVHEGELARGHALLESQWARIDQAGKFGFALRDLRAIVAD